MPRLTLSQWACLHRLAEAGATTTRPALRPAGVQSRTLAGLEAEGLLVGQDVPRHPRPHPTRPWPHPLTPLRVWRFTPAGYARLSPEVTGMAAIRVARHAARHKEQRLLRPRPIQAERISA